MSEMAITRKVFLTEIAGGFGLLVLGGCGGGGGYGGSPPMTPGTGFNCGATISGNHGHALTIPVADLNAANAMTYNIQGTADHAHSVTFSAAQMADLRAGMTVNVSSSVTTSSLGAHSHDIGERCA